MVVDVPVDVVGTGAAVFVDVDATGACATGGGVWNGAGSGRLMSVYTGAGVGVGHECCGIR